MRSSRSIPEELFECGHRRRLEPTILCRIVLPLSKAVIAVIGMFYAVAYWNSFFNAMLYIKARDKRPLQLVLRNYVVNQTPRRRPSA